MRSSPGIPFLLTYRFLDRNSDSVKGFQIETPVELKDAMEGLLLRDFRREESRQDSDLKKTERGSIGFCCYFVLFFLIFVCFSGGLMAFNYSKMAN